MERSDLNVPWTRLGFEAQHPNPKWCRIETLFIGLCSRLLISRPDGHPRYLPRVNYHICRGYFCTFFCLQVSFGPTIDGAHSPDEKVNIASVGKFWQLVLATLEGLAAKKG